MAETLNKILIKILISIFLVVLVLSVYYFRNVDNIRFPTKAETKYKDAVNCDVGESLVCVNPTATSYDGKISLYAMNYIGKELSMVLVNITKCKNTAYAHVIRVGEKSIFNADCPNLVKGAKFESEIITSFDIDQDDIEEKIEKGYIIIDVQ